eukprot:CAMPEP_0184750480 /NCGR_PEP_ID=MMETSP0315-20130426/36694_1 /TAXON_ID=101924 /ORGANISM="Rhodosorus marinus, Strain UTEX LB 2760" /LENGTH=428 /DNA_ID=CAMNT_0027228745 /DNA_START=315 /DNA_END=1601 /DNA_ORIENTATION=-
MASKADVDLLKRRGTSKKRRQTRTGGDLFSSIGDMKTLTASEARSRLSPDEIVQVTFLLRMRSDRGLSEVEAQELKEISFKLLTDRDPADLLTEACKSESSAAEHGMYLDALGISEEELAELKRVKKHIQMGSVTRRELLHVELCKQKLIDNCFAENGKFIKQLFDFELTTAGRKQIGVPEIVVPEICLAEYGNDFASDVFNIIYNGILREAIDLYAMLCSLKRRRVAVDSEDVQTIFSWWIDFRIFAVKSFEVEDQFILPWVTRRVNVSKTVMQQTCRNLRRSRIAFNLLKVSNTEEFEGRLPPGEVINRFHAAWENVFLDLKSYFQDTHRILVPMVARVYQATDKTKLEREIFNYLKGSDGADLVAGLWLRWMTPDQRKSYRKGLVGNIFNLRASQDFENLSAKFSHREHIHIPDMIIKKHALPED